MSWPYLSPAPAFRKVSLSPLLVSKEELVLVAVGVHELTPKADSKGMLALLHLCLEVTHVEGTPLSH